MLWGVFFLELGLRILKNLSRQTSSNSVRNFGIFLELHPEEVGPRFEEIRGRQQTLALRYRRRSAP